MNTPNTQMITGNNYNNTYMDSTDSEMVARSISLTEKDLKGKIKESVSEIIGERVLDGSLK